MGILDAWPLSFTESLQVVRVHNLVPMRPEGVDGTQDSAVIVPPGEFVNG
jgi:hypothetical protein